MSMTMESQIRNLQERLKKAEAERDGLREALRPFAEAYRTAMRYADGDDPSSWNTPEPSMEAFELADELVPES